MYDSTLAKASRAYGVVVNKDGTNAPAPAQLTAYKDAFWSGFAFGAFGGSRASVPRCAGSCVLTLMITGALMAVVFLRHAGIVGHRSGGSDAESVTKATSDTIQEEKMQPDSPQLDGAPQVAEER